MCILYINQSHVIILYNHTHRSYYKLKLIPKVLPSISLPNSLYQHYDLLFVNMFILFKIYNNYTTNYNVNSTITTCRDEKN